MGDLLFRIPLGDWVQSGVDWMTASWAGIFHGISAFFQTLNGWMVNLFTIPPFWVWLLAFAAIGWWAKGWKLGVGSLAGFLLIYGMGQWDNAMETLALVLLASAISIGIGVPLGIWAGRNKRVAAVVRPVLDFLQTMPAFVYLIPFVVLFSVGVVPAIVATVLFAIAPGVRFTQLGIREVDSEVIEAAYAFGATPRRVLFQVQLPLAMRTIMAGVNQVIMLSLSMVVIAGMVGAGGLGLDVVTALNRVNMSLGAEAGLSVVVLAMYLDRVTAAWSDGPSMAQRVKKTALDRLVKPTVLGLSLALAFGWAAVGAFATSSDSGQAIRIGVPSGWDEAIVVSAAMKTALEEQGYKVRTQNAEMGVVFTGLAEGDTDLLMDAWLPTTTADFVNQYQDHIEDLGVWYEDAKLTFAVNADSPLNSIADLATQGGAVNNELIGIDAGSGLTRITQDKVIPGYGLDNLDFKLSSTATMLGALKGALAANKGIAVTLWTPHWAYGAYDIKNLEDPLGLLGDSEGIHAFARRGFSQDVPEVATMIRNFTLSDEELSSLENYVLHERDGKNVDADTAAWLDQHPEVKQRLQVEKN